MSYAPIALYSTPMEDYAGWWIKGYQQGTVTPLSMATDSSGGTLLAKAEVSSGGAVPIGFFKTAGGALLNPHFNADYDLWLFPTEAEADADDTTNAIQIADNLNTDQLGIFKTDLANTSDISKGAALIGRVVESFANKAEAISATPVNGRKYFIGGADGGHFTGKTGGSVGQYNDDSANYCGKQFRPTGGDGSTGFLRDYESGEIYTVWYGDTGGGTADDYSFINDAQTAATASDEGLVITDGTHVIGTTITFTQPVRFTEGAILKPSNTIDINFGASISGPVSQHFDISAGGTVTKADGGQVEIYPEWWGCVGGDTSSGVASANTSKMQACLDYSLGAHTIMFNLLFTVGGALTYNAATKFVSTMSKNLVGLDFRVTSASSIILLQPDTSNSQTTYLCQFKNIKLNINANSSFAGAGEVVILQDRGRFVDIDSCVIDSQYTPSTETIYGVRLLADTATTGGNIFNNKIVNNWFNGKLDISLHIKGTATSLEKGVGITISNNEFLSATTKTTGAECDIWLEYCESIQIFSNRLVKLGNSGSNEAVNVRADNCTYLNFAFNYYEQALNGYERVVLGTGTTNCSFYEVQLQYQEIIDTDDDGFDYIGQQNHLVQRLTTGSSNREVMKFRQKHLSEPFLLFRATSNATAASPLVDAADLPTPGTITGWVEVEIVDDAGAGAITDGTYYIPFYTAPT